jgi:hypothetical protein
MQVSQRGWAQALTHSSVRPAATPSCQIHSSVGSQIRLAALTAHLAPGRRRHQALRGHLEQREASLESLRLGYEMQVGGGEATAGLLSRQAAGKRAWHLVLTSWLGNWHLVLTGWLAGGPAACRECTVLLRAGADYLPCA